MQTNNLDNNIKQKLQNRTFKPSASAWERLSEKLDEQPKQKKKGWFFYIGIAASILLLISIGIQLISINEKEIPLKNEVVIDLIDKKIIDKKIEEFKNDLSTEEAIVKTGKVEKKEEKTNNVIAKKLNQPQKKSFKKNIPVKDDKIIVAQVDNNKTNIISDNNNNNNNNKNSENFNSIKKKTLKQDPNSRIKISGDDLLYSVTHSKEEVKVYYAKYNVNRVEVLKSIKKELKKSNLKIDANTILAEVERGINEDDFQNNFMKSLKKRVRNIATVIASRNN